MRKIILVFIAFIFVVASFGFAQQVEEYSMIPEEQENLAVETEQYEKGKVLDIVEFEEENLQAVKIKIVNGDNKGEEIFVKNNLTGNKIYDIRVEVGDIVLLWKDTSMGAAQYSIADHVRERGVIFLLILFLVLILMLGRMQGVKALGSLMLTIILIYYFLLPMIIRGYDPIMVSIVISAIVAIVSFLLISGFTLKSAASILGTIGGVTVAGVLALAVGEAINLTGLASEESRLLLYSLPQNTNFQGILFSGIIIGALGAVMDVSISIASAIDEVKKHKPHISSSELFLSAINVGKDVMSTMTNTLILAYTGSSLPLLVLFEVNQISFAKGINLDLVATEIIRALAGSIGLISAIPITAYLASFVLYKKIKSPLVENKLD